jgi:hypothetical protein
VLKTITLGWTPFFSQKSLTFIFAFQKTSSTSEGNNTNLACNRYFIR